MSFHGGSRRMSYSALAALLLLLTASAGAWGQSGPELRYTCNLVEYLRHLPSTAYSDCQGLVVDEVLVREFYPLATALFFDRGSAEIASRYVVMTSPEGIARFTDTAIPGGTLQKYYELLNVIGFRMRNHPSSRITVTGCNSAEPKAGETRDLSARRGEAVRGYLVGIWGIDPARITVASRDLPAIPSDRDNPLGREENRRVEIASDDWEIVRPIVSVDLRRFPQPDTIYFLMRNGVPDSQVASREIEITWEGKPWHVMRNIGITDTVSPAYGWSRNDNPDLYDLPPCSVPYTARLLVHIRDGSTLRSGDVTIPVLVADEAYKMSHRSDSSRSFYTLVLFDYNRFFLAPLSQRVLREYIYPEIGGEEGRVEVIGHAGTLESARHSRQLAWCRATAVLEDMGRVVKGGSALRMEKYGAGEEEQIYPEDLPEGRFYNRTVQVRIVHPPAVQYAPR